MRKPEGREASHSRHREPPPPDAFRHRSSFPLDETDVEILSLVKERPMTILNVAEKMDLPFVEGLTRTRKLWRLGLLERTESEHEEVGLYRYSAKE